MEYFLIWLVMAVISALVANLRKRNPFTWFVVGLLIGLIAVIVVAILPPGNRGMSRCRECLEYIHPDASVCKHCGHRR